MKRQCKEYNIDEFIKTYPHLADTKVSLYIDADNYKEITDFLTKKDVFGNFVNKKKFNRILYQIINNRYDDDLYSSEKMSEKSKNVTAMKFKTNKNPRLYCKEFFKYGKKIVIICLHFKKTQKNDKRIKSIIDSISEYEYDF